MSLIDHFFAPVKNIDDCKELDYKSISHYMEPLIALSKLANQSIYIIDYYKKEFAYVAANPLFLCGYKKEEVKDMGYSYFEKVVIPEDLAMLLEINKNGFGFFYNLPVSRRDQCFISYDFRIKHQNGNIILVNHKLIPLRILSSGNMWLALCLVTLSENKKPGNVFIQMLNEPIKYNYSFKLKNFILFEAVSLSKRETEILKLTSMGYTSNEIATMINVDFNTVKFHKTNILKKLEAKNSSEAIEYAIANGII